MSRVLLDRWVAVLRRIAQSRFLLFVGANLAMRIGQLLLLMTLVYHGDTRDLGLFGLFTSFFIVVIPITTLNAHSSVGRLYFNLRSDEERTAFVRTNLSFALVCSTVGVLLVVALGRWGAVDLPVVQQNFMATALLVVATPVAVLNQFFFIFLKVIDRRYLFFAFGSIVGVSYLVYYFAGAALIRDRYLCAAVAFSAAQLTGVALATALTYTHFVGGAWNVRWIRMALPYSVGTAGVALVGWALNYGGRWVGVSHLSDNELAAYTLVTQLYAVVATLVANVWESSRIRILSAFADMRLDVALTSNNRCALISLGGVVLVYAVTFAALPVFPLLLPSQYAIGWQVLLWALLFNLLGVLSVRVFWIAIGLQRTMMYAWIVGAIAGLTLIVERVVVPSMGVEGLVATAAGGVGTQALVANAVFRRVLRTVKSSRANEIDGRGDASGRQ